MLSIEVQFVSNGRRLSLDDVADLVAGRVANRIMSEVNERLVPPQPVRASEPKMVSVSDSAKLLGVSRSTLWRYIQEKRIEVVHLGPRTTRIRMETINSMVRDGIPGPRREGLTKNRIGR